MKILENHLTKLYMNTLFTHTRFIVFTISYTVLPIVIAALFITAVPISSTIAKLLIVLAISPIVEIILAYKNKKENQC